MLNSEIACNEPLTFKGSKGPGKYTGKDLKISGDGVLIAARGHMHVSSLLQKKPASNLEYLTLLLGRW